MCSLRPQEHLQVCAKGYRKLFEELVQKDLDVFEERRLQDVLLCRAQAPSYSIKDQDFHTLWECRLTELLDKRQLYLQVSLSARCSDNLYIIYSSVCFHLSHPVGFVENGQHFGEAPGQHGFLSQ